MSDEEIQSIIDKRLFEAKTKSSSPDEVVQIAWKAQGIDLWHKSNGSRGHSPEDALRYIISSITRYTARQVAQAERAAQERLLDELASDDFFSDCGGCSCDAFGIIQSKRQALQEKRES